MKLANKIALVTGGGTGIGRATCLALAQRGATVIVNYAHSQSEALETVQMLQNQGEQAMALQADVAQESEVRAMVATIVRQFGSVDLLVNNASITRHIPFDHLEEATEEVWDELYAVNVKGMFFCARAVAPLMKARQEGAIVNVGSIAGLTGVGSCLPYAVSKAAVHGLTKSLAHALAPEIRVCCVVPGAVQTRWWAGQEERLQQLSPRVLLRRLATPDDIAQSICAALEQDAMTGQIITVDSGQTL